MRSEGATAGAPLAEILEQSALNAQEVQLDPGAVVAALGEHHGFAGTLKRIATEKDDTFVLAPSTSVRGGVAGRTRLLVKVSSSYEDPQFVDLQSEVLDHIAAADPSLPVPRIIPALDGRSGVPCFAGSGAFVRVLRVLTFLEGEPMGAGPTTARQRAATGELLAGSSLALADFTHPAAGRLMAWDIQHFPALAPLLDTVEDPALRGEIERQMEQYAERILPRLPEVRFQVVHNDLNRHNVLVAGERAIAGIIDFGDAVRTAIPFDLAIGAAGHLSPVGDPWAQSLDVIRGYLTKRPLTAPEIEMAVRAAPVRIALRALLTCYQSSSNPQRAEYLNSHDSNNLAILRAVANVRAEAALAQLPPS